MIKTKAEYKAALKRLDKANKIMKDKWFDPKYKKWNDVYDKIGQEILDYEIEHDLIP